MDYLSINGTIIENAIAGFNSFNVSGRNMPETEIETVTVGNRNGDVFKSKRYAGRTLTVSYALIAATESELMRKFERLNAILDAEEAQIIFGDDPTVFYIGTKTGITEPQGAQIAMSGKIEFYCSDPYKYSVEEYDPDYHTIAENGSYSLVNSQGGYIYDDAGNKITFDVPTFGINYNGTMPSYPRMTANVAADLGYIAFIDNDSQIIQLGDPEETEGEDYKQNETLISSKFTAMPAAWAASTTAKFPAGKLEGSTKIASVNGTSALTANSYGSTLTGTHGCAVTAAVPADSEGNTGAVNCKFEFKYIFKSSKTSQAGRITFAIGNTSKYFAAIQLYKGKDSKSGYAYLYVNGVQKNRLTFTAGSKSAFTQGTASITKYGSKITFVIGGKTYSYTDSALADSVVTNANIYFGREVYKKTKTTNAQCSVMGYIGVYTAQFIKNYVEKWRDVPNKFAAGDEIVVDCESASITINGNDAAGFGAMGNDWETFTLEQGTNYIGCAFSEWTETPPTFGLKYRKVYI